MVLIIFFIESRLNLKLGIKRILLMVKLEFKRICFIVFINCLELLGKVMDIGFCRVLVEEKILR